MAAEKGLLSDKAYRQIKDNIINGVYAPGQLLTESALAESLGMSRQPIRMAVHRLNEDNWLIAISPHKLQVKPFFEKDLKEIFEIRNKLELDALYEIFLQNKTWEYSFALEALILKMKENIHDRNAFEKYDLEFHSYLIQAFNNVRLSRFYESNREEILWISMMANEKTYSIQNQIDELSSIVKAIRNNDYESARKTYTNHLDAGFQRIHTTLCLPKEDTEV